MNSIPKIPAPVNEPVLSYAPGTPERAELKQALQDLAGRAIEIPVVIAAARAAWREWSAWSLADRAAVFLKAADLLATRGRAVVNAATMLGQSKTAHQAEIDAACELIDFWRFNVHYAEQIHAEQPISSSGMWNALDYRALEGFVYAISPFNFTS